MCDIGKVTITGYDLKSYTNCLKHWERSLRSMLEQCEQVGVGVRCLPVYYELLILEPELWMRRVLAFLDLPWHDSVLRHQDYIDPEGPGLHAAASEGDHVQLSKYVRPLRCTTSYFFLSSVGYELCCEDLSEFTPDFFARKAITYSEETHFFTPFVPEAPHLTLLHVVHAAF